MTAPTLLPGTSPLIAPAPNTNTWHSGINLLDDAASLHQGITSGSWIESGLGAAGTAMDVLTVLSNPVGALVSYGLNFLIEHIKPLQDALNWFAGNSGQVSAYGSTWGNVSSSISGASSSYLDALRRDTAGWTGQAADNYRNFAQDKINTLNAAAKAANTIGSATQLIGGLVGTVRNIIRDLVTQAMGQIIQTALAAVFVVSIPAVVAKVATEVVSWMRKIANTVQQLTSSMTKLQPLMGDLQKLWGTVTQSLAKGGQQMETVAADLEKGIQPQAPSARTAPKSTDPARDPLLSRDAAFEQHEAGLAELDAKLDKQYTRDYERGRQYRTEVEQILGPPPANGSYVAHHTFPVNNSPQFKNLGIDTTNPVYGAWVDKGAHESFSSDYGKAWDSFFANTPNPAKQDAIDFARTLAQQYGYEFPM